MENNESEERQETQENEKQQETQEVEKQEEEVPSEVNAEATDNADNTDNVEKEEENKESNDDLLEEDFNEEATSTSESKKEKKRLRKAKDKEKKKKRSRSDKEDKKKKKKKKNRHEKAEKEDKVEGEEEEQAPPQEREEGNEEGEEQQEPQEGGEEEGEEGGGYVEEPPKDDFDMVLESLKKGSRRRKGLSDTEIVVQTDIVADFISRMARAAEEDAEANREGRPALAKIKMLAEVAVQLEKRHLQQIFIDEHVLVTLKKWLDPMPDGSLPNMKVRETILRVLQQFPMIDVDELKDSEIGKIVMFLWKHPQETAGNKKMCKGLIERWSRPIFGITEKYVDKNEDIRPQSEPTENRRRDSQGSSSSSSSSREKNLLHDLDSQLDRTRNSAPAAPLPANSPAYHARIPQRSAMDYKIQPKSDIDPERLKKKGNNKLVNKFEKKFQQLKGPASGKSVRANNMSIEGRRLETRI